MFYSQTTVNITLKMVYYTFYASFEGIQTSLVIAWVETGGFIFSNRKTNKMLKFEKKD